MWVTQHIFTLKCYIHTLPFPVSLPFFCLDAITYNPSQLKMETFGHLACYTKCQYRNDSKYLNLGTWQKLSIFYWKNTFFSFHRDVLSSGGNRYGCVPVTLCEWLFWVSKLVSAGWQRIDFKLAFRKQIMIGGSLSSIVALLSQWGTHTFCSSVWGTLALIAQSQGYSDSGEFGTLFHLAIKNQRQLSLLPLLQMTVEYQSKSSFL